MSDLRKGVPAMAVIGRRGRATTLTLALAAVFFFQPSEVLAESAGQSSLATATRQQKFAFILFYRTNNAATQAMYKVLHAEVERRDNAALVPLNITDAQEREIVEQYDASRTPMPAVMAVAPNGAITGVFAQKLLPAHVESAIVTPAQTQCMRALQDKKLVLLCVHPAGSRKVPVGVQQFRSDSLNVNRTHLVSIQAGDPAEVKFLQQLKVRSDTSTAVTAFMAPPGVLLGTYNDKVTPTILMNRLAAAGQCCADPNCKHRQAASAARPTTRR
ncbi:MAG: hypothetical protein GY758_22995 [Fuerstiella sp.]|nr:hypothetical protein [Fuerstiella sp.]